MPHKTGPKRRLANVEDREPFIPAQLVPLNEDEQRTLREFLSSPLWQKVISNARLSKPTVFFNSPQNADHEMIALLERRTVNELRGWGLYEAAIVRQLMPVRKAPPPVSDEFPDEGRIDFKPKTK